jgi:hypothetical protein
MADQIQQLISYRNQAEELRVIAEGLVSTPDREALLRIAGDYDRMASSLEGAIRSRNAGG